MLRIEEADHWLLVTHQDHARLAGQFGALWGNEDFEIPEPTHDILTAVSRHDDAWEERDAQPKVTRDGRPAAFSQELVGRYTAFEDIDLADYLRVRGQATESVAADNPYAGILVSMHTLNLLTEQADLTTLSAEERILHRDFVERQRVRQQQLVAQVSKERRQDPVLGAAERDRAFRFLQACDSLSLIVCVRMPRTMELRHRHRLKDGSSTTLECRPVGPDTYEIHPYPFGSDSASLRVPYRRVPKRPFPSDTALRAAYAQAAPEYLRIQIGRTTDPARTCAPRNRAVA